MGARSYAAGRRTPVWTGLAALPVLTLAAGVQAAPVMVSPAAHKAMAPEVAVGPRGEVYVAWLEKPAADAAAGGAHDRHASAMNLWLARSDDGGRSFAAPVRVNSAAGEVWGFTTSKPRVAVGDKGTVHLLWPANATGPAGKPILEIHYARSTDRGASFSPARLLNTTVESDASALIHGGFAVAHAFQTLVAGPGGTVNAIWIDTRSLKAATDLGEVYMVRSTDDGESFEPEVRLFGGVCPCCQLTASYDAAGRLWLGSRQVTGDNLRTPAISRSDDRGRSFAERVAVAGPAWQLEGCPLKPTAIAVDGEHVYTAAFNGGAQPAGVWFSASHDGGRSFGGAQPLHPEAAVADAPVLAVGAKGTLHAVWHAKVGETRRLYTRSSGDHGRNWGPISELPTPAGPSAFPALARSAEASYLVWQQGEQVWLDRLP